MRTIMAALTAVMVLALSACSGGSGGGTAGGMMSRINALRATAGAGAVSANATLTAVAQGQADYNEQQGQNGDTNAAGENIAQQLATAGYASQFTTSAVGSGNEAGVFSGWDNIQGIHDQFVDPDHEHIGVGVAQGNGGEYWILISGRPAGLGRKPLRNAVKHLCAAAPRT